MSNIVIIACIIAKNFANVLTGYISPYPNKQPVFIEK